MKILVADDDSTSRQMVCAMSRRWGYTPIEAVDGHQAWLEITKEDAPTLLLLDWMMPGFSGLELCLKLSELSANTPYYVIMLTAKDQVEDIVKGLNAGANDYISKPFLLPELKARLNVGQRMLETQQQLIQTQHALQHERQVIENTILRMRKTDRFNHTHIKYLQSGVEKTVGDIVLSSRASNGSQYLMLGDFTGHGLTAAIGAPWVSELFYSLCKQHSAIEIIQAINQYCYEKLPTNLFLAAIFIEINSEGTCLNIWNFAMHDTLFYRQNTLAARISAQQPALGILSKIQTCSETLPLQVGDRCFLFTDGIIEADNKETMYGQTRLEVALTEMLRNNESLESIEEAIHTFCQGNDPLDDLTLLQLSF